MRGTSGTVVSERMIGGGDGGEPVALDVPAGSLDVARQFFVLCSGLVALCGAGWFVARLVTSGARLLRSARG